MTARGLRIVPGDAVREVEPQGPLATVTLPASAAALIRLAPTAEERRWANEAICASGDPDRLFVTGAAQREAAKLCRNCPVQMECLADALDNQVEFGVWGGLTERQRRALLKQRPDVRSWRVVLERAKDSADVTARRGVAS
jgi:WhiB family redox-sensing transcriptional regulator